MPLEKKNYHPTTDWFLSISFSIPRNFSALVFFPQTKNVVGNRRSVVETSVIPSSAAHEIPPRPPGSVSPPPLWRPLRPGVWLLLVVGVVGWGLLVGVGKGTDIVVVLKKQRNNMGGKRPKNNKLLLIFFFFWHYIYIYILYVFW